MISWLLYKINKKIHIKPMFFFVLEFPMSLRHSCQPFGEHQVAEEGRSLIGDPNTKNTTGFISIFLLILSIPYQDGSNHQESHS